MHVALPGRYARLREGDVAPDFELPDADSRPVRLSDFRGRPVVLYFYPHDFTPVCTREGCEFRDSFEAFRELGAVILGVSGDPPESHARFAARHRFPFRLLSDADGDVRRRYGVTPRLGVWPGRTTFVIDAEGRVRWRYRSQLRGRTHVEGALKAAARLAAGRP